LAREIDFLGHPLIGQGAAGKMAKMAKKWPKMAKNGLKLLQTAWRRLQTGWDWSQSLPIGVHGCQCQKYARFCPILVKFWPIQPEPGPRLAENGPKMAKNGPKSRKKIMKKMISPRVCVLNMGTSLDAQIRVYKEI
jgi:hypothetical protein